MKLPVPPAAYSVGDQAQTRFGIEREFTRCVMRDEEYQPVRLVLADTVTGTRYLVTVAAGVLTLTAV